MDTHATNILVGPRSSSESPTPFDAGRRHSVIVVGAGFGGLAAAKALADAPVDVTLIDARNHHTFQPLLYQVATAGLDAENVCFPIRGIFHGQRNLRVRLDVVTQVDPVHRTVTLGSGGRLRYDHLICACGAITNTFGVPGVAEHSFGLKTLADAVAIRSHVLHQFEIADSDPNRIPDGALTVVVAGGGPTGVELAGSMAELFDKVLTRDFPHLDVRQARVVLIEATDRVLGTFEAKLSRFARRALERRGVEVLVNTTVSRCDSESVTTGDGRTIPTHTLVWAAGVAAHPLGATFGTPLHRSGRVVVEPDLSLPGHPEVFVVGDLAAARSNADPGGTLLPQVAPVAIQGARHAARMILSDLEAGPSAPIGRRTPFRYHDKGSMATIGRHAAVAQLPSGRTFTGATGWLAWLGLHLVMLIGFRNRANVLVNWAWNYLTYDRGSRLIPDDHTPDDHTPSG